MQLRSFALSGVMVFGLTLAMNGARAQEVEAGAEYLPPQCELNTGHFLIKNTQVYLKGATEEQDSVKAQEMLENAKQNLTEALQGDQADNPAAWYFLGRYHVMTEDAIGADSAFDRAMQLAPDCERDITYYRQVMWAPRINAAIEALNAGNYEAAKEWLHEANALYDEDNIGYYYLAVIYGQENELDSARHYFKRVAEVGAKDSTREGNVEVSTYNVGLLYGAAEEWDSARVWYERYHELKPEDPQGFTGLATAYAELGNMDRAATLYDSVFAFADSLTMTELLEAGQNLFQSDRLELAARAFALALEKNPYHRDGLYNLTNTYLALGQDTSLSPEGRLEASRSMEQVARRLVGVEPLGHEALRLLAAAFQFRRQDDSTLTVLQRVENLPLGIEIYQAQRMNGEMSLRGTISNMRNAVTEIPTITFEFLDEEGNVLTTDTLALEQLDPHGSQDFEVSGVAEDIAGWRYTLGS